jgi:DNA transformation protein
MSQGQEAARARALEIADRLTGLGIVSVSRFFSGAAIAIDGVQFAFIIEGTLYFRTDETTRADFEALGAAPFVYERHARRRVKVSSYFEAPDAIVDDAEALRQWAARSHRAAVAARTLKPRKKRGT